MCDKVTLGVTNNPNSVAAAKQTRSLSLSLSLALALSLSLFSSSTGNSGRLGVGLSTHSTSVGESRGDLSEVLRFRARFWRRTPLSACVSLCLCLRFSVSAAFPCIRCGCVSAAFPCGHDLPRQRNDVPRRGNDLLRQSNELPNQRNETNDVLRQRHTQTGEHTDSRVLLNMCFLDGNKDTKEIHALSPRMRRAS